MSRPGNVVGRLAPSPTGGLHLGHARTFLLAWLAARSAGGRMVLRIEDIDSSRVRPGMAEAAMADLRWLGLDWDEGPDVGGKAGPYVQSGRLEIYRAALERLRASERVYPCTCTRAEIARAASAPHAEDEGPTYPGTCAGRSASEADGLLAAGKSVAWRFRVPAGDVEWDDLYLGRMRLDPSRSGGDFLVGREGVGPGYQLAVTVDDAAMGITQVIRGDDLVGSTPRQTLIYRALGATPPRFGHVPLVLGPDGRRLAKRDHSIKLGSFREARLDPRILVGRLARSCGWRDIEGPIGPAELLGRVDPLAIPRVPWAAEPADLGPR